MGTGRWVAVVGCALGLWGGAGARGQSVLTSYYDGMQCIDFVGPDQHLYQIVNNGSGWTSQDVTAVTGLPVVASGSVLSSFVDGGAISVAFFGSNQHVYEAVYLMGQGWTGGVDLTAASGAPAAARGSSLTSYVDGAQNWVYQGANQHIYEIVFSGSWGWTDTTATSGAPLAAAGSALSSFVDGGAIGISYIATNQHVDEVVYLGSEWSWADVTAGANLPLAGSGSGVTSYVQNAQNWVYEGANQHLYVATFNGAWSGTDITAASSLAPAAAGSALSSFVQGSAVSVSFFDTSHNLWEAVYIAGQGWKPGVNMTTGLSLPAALAASGLTSYETSGSQDWVYQADNGIWLTSFNGSWSDVNLTAATGLQWVSAPAKEYVHFNGKAVAIENNPQ